MPYDIKNPFNLPAPPGFQFGTNPFGSPGDIYERAAGADYGQTQRYEQGRGILTSAFEAMQPGLKGIDPDLLFSQATDAIGARGKNRIESLRGSLGARGISPNSGAANSLLQRMAFDDAQATQGARLGAEIEAQRSRERAAVINWNAATGLADFVNQDVPMLMLDAAQNQGERSDAMYMHQQALKAQKKANRANLFASILQGAGGPLTSLLPG